jgi:hypothetical protein
MIGLFLIFLALLLLVGFVAAAVYYTKHPQTQSIAAAPLPYRRREYFFTRSEQQLFRILSEKLDSKRFRVFPKVRLGDFIETTNGGDERWGSWNRIKSRHVDFLIWDNQAGKVVVAIELDGNSHNGTGAKEADGFKNEVFKTIGLPLHRIRVGSDFAHEVDQLRQDLGL